MANEGRLTITLDGVTFFDDVVDVVEANHSIQRQIDPLDFDPKQGTVTLTATYATEPKPFELADLGQAAIGAALKSAPLDGLLVAPTLAVGFAPTEES